MDKFNAREYTQRECAADQSPEAGPKVDFIDLHEHGSVGWEPSNINRLQLYPSGVRLDTNMNPSVGSYHRTVSTGASCRGILTASTGNTSAVDMLLENIRMPSSSIVCRALRRLRRLIT